MKYWEVVSMVLSTATLFHAKGQADDATIHTTRWESEDPVVVMSSYVKSRNSGTACSTSLHAIVLIAGCNRHEPASPFSSYAVRPTRFKSFDRRRSTLPSS